MSKAKAYTKMILERLNRKADADLIKSNANSNQKTQATPSEHHQIQPNARNFFDNFEKHCAVYHEPSTLAKNRKPMKRTLFFELSDIRHRANNSEKVFDYERKERLTTEPYKVSEFVLEEHTKMDNKIPKIQERELRSMTTRRVEESKITRPISSIQGCQYINRYRSLKTLPSKSTVGGEGSSHRRILVTSSQMPIERRDSFEKKDFRM